MTDRARRAPPKASAMIEALRGLGYTTATALADVIDNAIAAAASTVDVMFSWAAKSTIRILDNGNGMTASELELAMRLGERNPLHHRGVNDLGRFGLGLKTASFSQARRLTVASCKDGESSSLHWDLDRLGSTSDDGWYLYEGAARGSETLLEPLGTYAHGTLVLWENLDRIVTPTFKEQDFLDLIDRVERHLGMVFHRFISGDAPRICLRINGRVVPPWDPFLTDHPGSWESPVARFLTDGGTVTVQCHVLPHRDRLDAQTYELAAGIEGWTSHQGIYIYRNERLLVAGSWLGLGRGRHWTKEEAHRLARIRVDIPNTADAAWKLDVLKSTAVPPVTLRERLTRLAEDTRERARRVFAHRGQGVRTGGSVITQAWRSERFSTGMRYRIDHNHPAVKAVIDSAGELEPLVRAMLRVLEETIPVQRIWLDTAEGKETPRTSFSGEPPEAVTAVLLVMYRTMVRQGLSSQLARDRLLRTEPFQHHPELVASLPDNPEEPIET